MLQLNKMNNNIKNQHRYLINRRLKILLKETIKQQLKNQEKQIKPLNPIKSNKSKHNILRMILIN
jgi:hypothetical protein